MKSYFNLKHMGVKESVNFGLDPSNLVQEKYALVVSPVQSLKLQRTK
jgi:KUP system potassium uptake protein